MYSVQIFCHSKYLDVDFSRSFKVKTEGAVEFHIYALLLRFNSNIWLNSAPFFIRYKAFKTWVTPSLNFQGVTQGQIWMCSWTPICDFLLVFNSNIWPGNSDPLWYIRLQSLSDLDFDLSKSLKAKSECAVAWSLPTYDFPVNVY